MMSPFNLISGSNKESGMTLMEVMIAIVLLAFVMIGVVTVTQNSMSAKERTIQVNKDNLQIENALNRFEWDFTQIYSPLYFTARLNKNLDPSLNGCSNCQDIFEFYEGNPRFRFPNSQGLPVPIFAANGKDELIIMTTSNRRKIQDMKQSNFVWVRYSLGDGDKEINEGSKGGKENSTGKNLVRQIANVDPFSKDTINWEEIKTSTLLEDVESLEFLYYSTQTKKYESSLTASPQGEHLVRGIQVKVKWADSQGNKREMTRYYRPLWPPIIPQDPALPAAAGTTTTGTNGGTATSGNTGQTTEGTNGGDESGAEGGGDPE